MRLTQQLGLILIGVILGFFIGVAAKLHFQTCLWEYSVATAPSGVTIMTPYRVCK